VNHGTELQQSFSALLDQHVGFVWRVAFAWCRQATDREDLVQEIHYQLWRAFPRFDSNRTFSTWMYRIALNVAISNDRRRKRAREERLPDFPEPTGLMPRPTEDSRISELFQVVDGLDGTNRALLLLWLDNHSYAAIAEVLGLSETNVATRLSRLKQKLS
jgi:RNA polymerase sigma-70 factor (ECF subfamily)